MQRTPTPDISVWERVSRYLWVRKISIMPRRIPLPRTDSLVEVSKGTKGLNYSGNVQGRQSQEPVFMKYSYTPTQELDEGNGLMMRIALPYTLWASDDPTNSSDPTQSTPFLSSQPRCYQYKYCKQPLAQAEYMAAIYYIQYTTLNKSQPSG